MSDDPHNGFPLRLEWLEPAALPDNPANWRTHPEVQTAALDGVLRQLAEMRDAKPGSQWAGALAYNERTGRLVDGFPGYAWKDGGNGRKPRLADG